MCGERGREVMCEGVEERRCCVSGEGGRKLYRGHIHFFVLKLLYM